MTENSGRLLILYDNNSLKNELLSAWGFSCLAMFPEYHILFDAGGDPWILFGNMQEMGIDPGNIDSAFLSHNHGDHIGGLSAILQLQPHVNVYIPESFPKRFREDLVHRGVGIKEVNGPFMIHPGVYTTGELGDDLKEQSLVLKTGEGLIIISGCAHPGILRIVDKIQGNFHEDVYLLLGGFHLMHYSPSEIMDIARRLEGMNVKRIAPCHCSGDGTRGIFRDHFGDGYIDCGVGLIIEVPGLIASSN